MAIHFKIHMSGVRAQARLKPIVQASKKNDNRNFGGVQKLVDKGFGINVALENVDHGQREWYLLL